MLRSSRFLSVMVALVAVLVAATPPARLSPPSVSGLVELAGRDAFVLYTPGALDRASHVQDWLERLGDEYAAVSGDRVRLGAYLLNRREWRSSEVTAPYGFPRAAGEGRIVIPAFGDEGTVALWLRYQPDGLPILGGSPLRGTPEEAASLVVADQWALFETARGLIAHGAVRGGEPWIDDLLAHALVLQALEGRDREGVSALRRFWSQLGKAAGAPPFPDADDASRAFNRWIGYQSGIHAMARRMEEWEGRRTRLCSRLWRLGKKDDGVLTEERLRKRYGELLASP